MSAPLDADVLATLRALGDDEGFFAELVDLFLHEASTSMKGVHDALARGDANGVRLAAHALKGSAANMGARQVASAADALDTLGRTGSLDGAAGLVQTLVEALEATTEALERERQGPAGPS